jgi:hypothetical protein
MMAQSMTQSMSAGRNNTAMPDASFNEFEGNQDASGLVDRAMLIRRPGSHGLGMSPPRALIAADVEGP